MKKAVSLALAIAVSASSALALDAGPGGRLYTTKVGSDGIGILSSLVIGSDWTITEAAGVQGKWQDTTSTTTNGNTHRRTGISPEIMTPAGTGFAKLTWGIYGTAVGGANSFEMLQIGEIQTSAEGKAAGGTDAMMAVGAGRAWTNATTPSTFGPTMFYDRTGSFSGHAGAYFMNGYNTAAAKATDNVIWNTAGTADQTDDIADFHYFVGFPLNNPDKVYDIEIMNNKLMASCTYYASGGKGFYYYKVNDTATAMTAKAFYMDGAPAGSPVGTLKLYSTEMYMATGSITGADGSQHEAVWGITYDSAAATDKYNVTLFADLNDDGDAMDAELNEYRVIFRSSSSTVSGDDTTNAISDMELVTGTDGKKFLMFNNNGKLEIIQIAADGTWQGSAPEGTKVANDYVKVLSVPANGLAGLTSSFEFDAVVPEPATMCLIGMGGLGMLLRRRRA